MPWQDNICTTFLAANVALAPMLDCVESKEQTHELHSPKTTYEQLIETPKKSKVETLKDLSEMTKDITEVFIEVKEIHDKAEEMIERTKLPSYSYSDRPLQDVDSQTKRLVNSKEKTHDFYRLEYNIKPEKTPFGKISVMDEKSKALAIERTIAYSGRVNQVTAIDDETRRQERQLRREQERAELRNRTSELERGR